MPYPKAGNKKLFKFITALFTPKAWNTFHKLVLDSLSSELQSGPSLLKTQLEIQLLDIETEVGSW